MTKGTVVIPARGGSKGLPRKNIKMLRGKPLIAWSIEAALQALSVEKVCVSTDDGEIAQIAQRYGASVIDRPAELAGDSASSESALLHALDALEVQGESPQLLIFLQCTSPLTQADDIDQAVHTLIEQEADCCFSATPSHAFLWKNAPDGNVSGLNHEESIRLRRQDVEPEFRENGAIYVMRSEGFREAKHRFFGKIVLSEMPAKRSVEIDDALDFEVVSVLMGTQLQECYQKCLPGRIAAVLFDFDGVMTDNRVSVDQEGRESVSCDRSDGMGIAMLKKAGVSMAVLSTEVNPVVSARCEKLGLECRQGLGDGKLAVFDQWCENNQIAPQEVIFVGNDVNDLACLRASGCGVVPADAHPEAKQAAQIVLKRAGGRGAVRELCDLILSLKK